MKADVFQEEDHLWMWDVAGTAEVHELLDEGATALHEEEFVVGFKYGAEYAARYLVDMRHRHQKNAAGEPMSLGERSAAAAIHMLDGLDQKLGSNPLEHEVQVTLCAQAIEIANSGLRQLYLQQQPVAA